MVGFGLHLGVAMAQSTAMLAVSVLGYYLLLLLCSQCLTTVYWILRPVLSCHYDVEHEHTQSSSSIASTISTQSSYKGGEGTDSGGADNTNSNTKAHHPGLKRSLVRAVRPQLLPPINYLDLLRLDHPSDFVMYRALQLTQPARHKITRDEPPGDEHPLVLTFLAYATDMPHATALYVEKSVEYPPRWRLSRQNKPIQRRDISKWKLTGERFYVYTNTMPGTTALHLDWQTSPDRYVISDRDQPEPLLTRCLTFFAYTITQVYVLKRDDGTESYRMYRGNDVPEREGWHMHQAFRVLDRYTLGTNRYFVQYLTEPFPRIRVAMTPANAVGWVDDFSFYAFDVPVKGTQRYSVYQRTSVPLTRAKDPEQYMIGTGMVTGPWMWRLDFFAFPIPPPSAAAAMPTDSKS